MLGKWNKSVILSYIGLSISILGIVILSKGIDIKYAMVCLIFAGVCDMFDGTIARRCKRTKEEKLFGIELDSLVDVFSFIVFPIVILLSLNINVLYCFPVFIIYTIFGIARLAHFNITTENINKPNRYYEGLPVTLVALIFPLIYLLSFIIDKNIFNILYLLSNLIVGILFIIKIKIKKPALKTSILLLLLAIIVSIFYLFVL